MKAKFFRGKRGSIIVLAAIVLPLLLAIAAVSLDAGYMYDYKQRMGSAADAAALGGAFEIKRFSAIDSATLNGYVRNDAARNGFTDGVGGVTITISRPPVTGLHIGDSKYVEVVISRPTPTFFAAILGRPTVTVNARAVAGPDEGTGCVYALHTADSKYTTEFTTQNGTNISVPNCDIIDNGNLTVVAGSSITSHAFNVTASSGTVSGTVTPTPTYNNAASTDPFADMDQASLFGTAWVCGWTGQRWPTGNSTVKTNISGVGAFAPSSGNNYQMNPGVYCGSGGTDAMKIGLKVNTGDPPGTCNIAVDDVVNFTAGIYIVNGGGLDWKHTCVTGTGVVFYLTADVDNLYPSCGGKVLSTDPPDRFFFSAPTASTANFKKWDGSFTSPTPYEGLLFIQDRRQSTGVAGAFPAVNCVANPVIADMLPQNMVMDGAIYFPDHHLLYGATSLAAGNYTILIGGTLEFKGAATFNSNFAGLSGGSPIKRPGLGE